MKFLSLFLDIRMPYFIPFILGRNIWRKFRVKKSFSGPIFVALTIDTEQDYGSTQINAAPTKTDQFLQEFPKYLKDRNWPATFFVQGDIVKTFSGLLRALSKNGHEIGLHGLHHELWGSGKWFLKDQHILKKEREKRLKKALRIFDKNKLKTPKSFRAPNLIIDTFSKKLLKKSGFQVDSSAAVFYGWKKIEKVPIQSIPVSSEAIAKFRFRFGLPFSNFRVFNLANLLKLDDQELDNYIKQLINFSGSVPHLVFLAHSWEFSASNNAISELNYCNEENYKLMFNKFDKLSKKYNLEFVTMTTLANKIFNERV